MVRYALSMGTAKTMPIQPTITVRLVTIIHQTTIVLTAFTGPRTIAQISADPTTIPRLMKRSAHTASMADEIVIAMRREQMRPTA